MNSGWSAPSWIESLDFSVFGAALLLGAMGLCFTFVIPGLDRWSRRFFTHFFRFYAMLPVRPCRGNPAILCCTENVFFVLMILESLLLSLLLLMLTAFLLHCCCESLRSSKLLRSVISLWAIFSVLLVSAPFIDGFVYITSENLFFRGTLYPLPMVPMIAALLLTFAGLMRRRARLSRKVFLAFLIAILLILAALTVHLFTDVFPLIDFSYVLSALAMYSLILSDQIEQDRRQQQEIVRQQLENTRQQWEIAHQRASVMVLQMRPHFIFNTLMSIHSLCRINPRKAEQITMDFTNYLRSNFNAVASDSPIPFSAELEHTRAYLALEQAQYDDMRIVNYEPPFTQFRLPPLTLQPIVENAVKHGMDLDSNPLSISIRTRCTDSGTEIIVQDNGPGFASMDESQPYTALTNIRQRLEMMCGGRITIKPRDDRGILVTIIIPDRKEEG